MFHRLKQTIAAHPVALALIFFLFYFAGFFGLEQLISQPKYIIYCGLDSLIPFNEWFIFAYGAWFALIPWALITLLIRDRGSYFYLCAVMFSGMAISLLLYLLFPAGQGSDAFQLAAVALAAVTLAIGNAAFLLFDRALANLLRVYKLLWQPRLHKMLGKR